MVKTLKFELSSLPKDGIYSRLASIGERCILQRCGASVCDDGEYTVEFRLDESFREDEYMLSDRDGGVLVTGGDFRALAYGMGKFLHSSKYSDDGMEPSAVRIRTAPDWAFLIENSEKA